MSARIKRWMGLTVLVAFGAAAIALTSCTTTVIPPPSPRQPVTVHLVDHGRTPSLVLPGEGNTLVRYAYGDWNYYALRKNDIWHGIAALFWPTRGALGRKTIEHTDSMAIMLDRFEIQPEHVLSIEGEREKAERLRQRLDESFEAKGDTKIVNEPYALDFVHHSRRYTGFYNSNHAVANWLRELGCEVRGPAMVSKWKIAK